jgi:hypothetical protein
VLNALALEVGVPRRRMGLEAQQSPSQTQQPAPATFGAAAAPFVVIIAAFAMGLCTTSAYCWLVPMFFAEK